MRWLSAVVEFLSNSSGSYPKQIQTKYQTDWTAADAEEHKMYMWLFRQLKAGTGCSSVAAVSVGRFDKLEQLSSNWPDTNEVFVFGKNRIKHEHVWQTKRRSFVRRQTDHSDTAVQTCFITAPPTRRSTR